MDGRQQRRGIGFMPSHPLRRHQLNGNSRAESILQFLTGVPEKDRQRFLRKQDWPIFLYKFKAVDPEKPYILEDLLVRSQLFLSSPESFNDPFDMRPRVTVDGRPADLVQTIKSLQVLSLKAKSKAIKRAERIWKERGAIGIAEEYRLQENLDELFRETGVFCFSTSAKTGAGMHSGRQSGPRNNLMWSHYGDNHKGICLQFKVSKDLGILKHLVQVSYSDNYPTINWLSPSFDQQCLYAATNKQSCWSYENEWRYVQLNSARTSVPFAPSLLAGIILGAKASETALSEVRRILDMRAKLGLTSVQIYRATLSPGLYGIQVHGLTA